MFKLTSVFALILASVSIAQAGCKVAAPIHWIFEDEPSDLSRQRMLETKDLFLSKGYTLAKSEADADFLFDTFVVHTNKSFGCLLASQEIYTITLSMTNSRTKEMWQKVFVQKSCMFSTGEEYKEEAREFRKEAMRRTIAKIPNCSEL